MDYLSNWLEVYCCNGSKSPGEGDKESPWSDDKHSCLVCSKKCNYSWVNTSAYHPQIDGLVEIFNRTLTAMLAKTVRHGGRDWDQQFPFALFAYRALNDSCPVCFKKCNYSWATKK